MIWFILITLLLGVLYVLKIGTYKHSWEKYPEFKPVELPDQPGISVIVAFRNEGANLPCLLESLEKQDFPVELYEVILVDDHSDDGSADMVRQYVLRNPAFRLYSNDVEESGKKAAILKGLSNASFELVVTTDADCTMDAYWLSSLTGFYRQYQPGMIIGLVDIKGDRGFFKKFQELEFVSLIAAGAAAAAGQKPVYCSGANLAYEKSTFMALDDPFKKSVASGDDTLFMLAVKRNSQHAIMLLKSKQAVVYTKGLSSWAGFINQRRRWISKSRFYRDRDTIYTAWLVFLTNLVLALSAVLCISGSNHWLFPVVLAGKTAADYLFLRSFMRFYRKEPPFLTFIVYELIYPLYVIVAAFSGIFTGYSWKGRWHGTPARRKQKG